MSRIGRHVRAAINPISTTATRWWCHSAVRHMLTGYGPTAGQRRLIRHGMVRGRQRADLGDQYSVARWAERRVQPHRRDPSTRPICATHAPRAGSE
jgi:hypothetical protein